MQPDQHLRPGWGQPHGRDPGALNAPADMGEAPGIDQGRDILAEIGYGTDEIQAMVASGAIVLR